MYKNSSHFYTKTQNNTQCFVSKLLPSSAVITIPAFVWVNGGKTTKSPVKDINQYGG